MDLNGLKMQRFSHRLALISAHISARSFDYLCSAFYLSWVVALFVNPDLMELKPYKRLYWNTQTHCLMYFLLFIFSLSSFSKNKKIYALSGIVMIIGGFMWTVTAIPFIKAYPPLTPGVMIFTVLGFICLIKGSNRADKIKRFFKCKGDQEQRSPVPHIKKHPHYTRGTNE